jgi:hypothetical protein
MSVFFEEFIPVYPSQDDKDIQWLITKKQEFLEKRAKIKESQPKRGETYLHQDFFLRYMIPYDRIFLMHETGTGKSCTMLTVARHYRKYHANYKRVFIIEKGPSTINDMKNQITTRCSAENEFETEVVRRSIDDKTRRRNINMEIRKWISLETYKSFISPVLKYNLTDEQISEYYSDSIFFLDEAQNLRNADENNTKDELETIYAITWKIFHLAKRSKICIASATLSVNDVNEFPLLFNLILPEDHQMPLDWDYKKVVLSQVEPFFRGRITFVRGLDTGAVPKYMGVELDKIFSVDLPDDNWIAPPYVEGEKQPEPPMVKRNIKSQMVVYPSYIEKDSIQYYAYEEALKKEKGDEEDEDIVTYAYADDNKKQVFWFGLRQASLFVFPDGSYGGRFPRMTKKIKATKGLGKYVKSVTADNYQTTDELYEYLTDPEMLKELSSKYSAVFDIEMANEGCSFIYTDFVSGGGAILVGQCFEARGIEKFNETSSVFEYFYDEETKRSKKRIKPSFKKKKRYALFLSDIKDSKRDAMMELWNSDENCDGEYICKFITSPTGKEGINVNHVLRGQIMTSNWTIASWHQAVSRFLRATSHSYLITRKAKKYEDIAKEYFMKGNEEKYREYMEKSKNVRIEVEIYNHVAIFDDGIEEHSIDTYIYEQAEVKNIYIQRLMRFAEQCSVDAMLNYERNVREGDKDYSITCRYQKCKYEPATAKRLPTDKEIDYSTYDILYSGKLIDEIISYIISIVKNKGFIYMTEILKINLYKNKYVYMAINKIIDEKTSIKDRFGYKQFLYFNGGAIFMQRDFPFYGDNILDTDIYSAYNRPDLYASQNMDFDTLLTIKQNPEQEKIIESIKNIENFTDEYNLVKFNLLLSKLNINTKVSLFENAIINLILHEESVLDREIYERFQGFITKVYEPWEDIEMVVNVLKDRPKIEMSKLMNSNIIKNLHFKGPNKNGKDDKGKNVPYVYIHSLYSSEIGSTNYRITSNFKNANGRIRLLHDYEEGELRWRDANLYEFPVYNNILKNKINEHFKACEKEDICGTVLQDGTFRLKDKTLKNKSRSGNEDKSLENNGRKCVSWEKNRLINILYRENLMPDDIVDLELPFESRDEIIDYLLEVKYTKDEEELISLTDDELEFIAKWYQSEANNGYICNLLKAHLNSQGRLLVI